VAVKQGKILFAGTDSEAMGYRSNQTVVYDLAGRTLIPGLHDAHLHFESGVENLLSSLSFRFKNLADIRRQIKEAIEVSPPGAIIRGVDFNQAYFENKEWPSCQDLDDIAPQNPVLIERVDGHSYWLNSKALQMSGITEHTPDPPGGEIQRFPNGRPSGILKENAMDLIKNITGPAMVILGQEHKNPLEAGIAYANGLGLTSVTTSGSLKLIAQLKQLQLQGKLTLRFNVWLPFENLEQYREQKVEFKQGDDFVRISFLKIFIDGTIGSATAAMFEPYRHRPDSKGLLIHPEDRFQEMVAAAHHFNWQIGVHAIGNRGVHIVLDAIEKAQQKYGIKGLRHRIEHSQFVIDEDIRRYKNLQVIPSMQPTHCTTDLLVVEDRIGKERAQQGYRWHSFHQAGIMMAFGTDWPVEPLDPRRGLYSAVARKNIETGLPQSGWFPQEQIPLTDAIQYYTLGSAYASFNENKFGSIEIGNYADFTIFDGDLLALEKSDKRGILTIPVYMTVINGKIVYKKMVNN